MKQSGLKQGEIRVLNIGRDAIFEWLYEAMIENAEKFFNIQDVTSVTLQCEWAQDSDEFTCVVESSSEADSKPAFHDFNFAKIRAQTGITTDSLFSDGRYKTLNCGDGEFLT